MSAPARALTVRHVQLLRALFAAAAALMITFSPDHSAGVGLSVFSGFVLATSLVFVLAAWLVLPAGRRWSAMLLAVLGFLAGVITSVPMWRSEDLFFAVVSIWALVTGAIEVLAGIGARRSGDPAARDAIAVGAFGLLLGVLLLVIPAGFWHEYTIAGAGTFQLTGIILGVGMLGGYAAIVAVFLGIAGLTPRAAAASAEAEDVAPGARQIAGTAPTERGGER